MKNIHYCNKEKTVLYVLLFISVVIGFIAGTMVMSTYGNSAIFSGLTLVFILIVLAIILAILCVKGGNIAYYSISDEERKEVVRSDLIFDYLAIFFGITVIVVVGVVIIYPIFDHLRNQFIDNNVL